MDRCAEVVTPIEQWFVKMDAALAQRENVLVLTTAEGSVFALTRYASMSAYLAGRELVDDIKAILSHMRAARADADNA
jgi:hypothetical protein